MFLYLMKHFMECGYAGEAPLPEKVENEGIYHPAHRGHVPNAGRVPRVVRTVVRANVRQEAVGPHRLHHPRPLPARLEPPGARRRDRCLGRARPRRDLLDDRGLQRAHRLAPASARSEDAQAAGLRRLSQRAALSRRLDVRRFARSDDRLHSRSRQPARLHLARQRRALARGSRRIQVRRRDARVHRQHRDARNRRHPAAAADLFARARRGDQRARADPRPRRSRRRRDDALAAPAPRCRTPRKSSRSSSTISRPGPGNVGVAYFLDVAALGSLDARNARRRRLRRRRSRRRRRRDEPEAAGMYAGEHTSASVSAGEIRDWVHDLPTGLRSAVLRIVGPAAGDAAGQGSALRQRARAAARHARHGRPHGRSTTRRRRLRRGCWPRTATRRGASTPTRSSTSARTASSSGRAARNGRRPPATIRSSSIDNVPHAYIFNVLDPVEASIARRRSYATILSHLCPPLRVDRRQRGSAQPAPPRARLLQHAERRRREARRHRRRDRRRGRAHRLPGRRAAGDADERAFVAAVHDELVALEGEFAPAGQHVFGRNLTDDDRLDTFHACLEFADVDIHRLVASCYGIDYDELARNPDAAGRAAAPTTTTCSTRSATPRAR